MTLREVAIDVAKGSPVIQWVTPEEVEAIIKYIEQNLIETTPDSP